jgi:hypothetical protein
MRYTTLAIAFVVGLALCPAAQARDHHREAHRVRVPIVSAAARDPSWRPPVAPGDIEPGGPGPSGW